VNALYVAFHHSAASFASVRVHNYAQLVTVQLASRHAPDQDVDALPFEQASMVLRHPFDGQLKQCLERRSPLHTKQSLPPPMHVQRATVAECHREKDESAQQFAYLKFATGLFCRFCSIAHIEVHQASKHLTEQAKTHEAESSLGEATIMRPIEVLRRQLRLDLDLLLLTEANIFDYARSGFR
jgi:hypothetical protein